MNNHQLTKDIEIGDFIEVPSWGVTGRVINILSALYGDDSALRVIMEMDPDGEETETFHLEDGQFVNLLQ